MISVFREVIPLAWERGDFLPISQYAVRQMAAEWYQRSEDEILIFPTLANQFRGGSTEIRIALEIALGIRG